MRAAELYQRLGHSLRQAGAGSESFAAFDRAVALLPPGPSAERARVLEERARVEMLLGDYAQGARDRHAGDRRRARVGAELTEVRALITLGFTRAGLGDEAEGIATLREAHARAGAIASPADRGRAAVNLSEALDLAGRDRGGARASSRAELAEARKRPERTSFDAFLAIQEASLLIRLGRLAEAREAAALADAGRGDLLHRDLLARHARAAGAARGRPARDCGRSSRRCAA